MERSLYLLGIGGVGMVWIADYALAQGWKVSGSDVTETDQTRRLREAGADIFIGVDPSTIPDHVTEGIMTAAISESAPGYPMLRELEKRNIPIHKRSEWTGQLTRKMKTIAVAGTHGKTTTTAMIGWILDRAGLHPTVFAGTNIPAWGNATKIGTSDILVLEADEYDRSFHRFFPEIAVVLNIDLDHTDYYTGGLPEIEKSFHRFLRNLPNGVHPGTKKQGTLVAYGRNASVRKAVKGFKVKFRWYDEDSLYAGIAVPQPGMMNRLNATAAAKVAHELGVEHDVIVKALADFPGVGRRFEALGTWNKAEFYSDYAHHPVEIKATLQAIRERWPKDSGKKVTIIFQPHQKARTKALLSDFAKSFSQNSPDEIILAPIYYVPGREEGIEVDISDLESALRPNLSAEVALTCAHSEAETAELAEKASHESDVLFIMGAGSIAQQAEQWRNI